MRPPQAREALAFLAERLCDGAIWQGTREDDTSLSAAKWRHAPQPAPQEPRCDGPVFVGCAYVPSGRRQG